jgi:hypothetical protein
MQLASAGLRCSSPQLAWIRHPCLDRQHKAPAPPSLRAPPTPPPPPPTPCLLSLCSWVYFVEYFNTKEGADGIQRYDEFYHRARTGTLPAYSWILPREGANATTGEGSNDDHPCHDIRLGEKLLKDTYEALRAGPGWNKTLLFITYDDSGGWYDHAPLPTAGIPRPDDEYGQCGTTVDTNWLGMRVPSLLISPWVSKGKVIHDPDGPTPTSKYEHSSLLSALKTIFDLPNYLTRRDEWAGDFSKELVGRGGARALIAIDCY